MLSSSAAAIRRWFANARTDESLSLESFERRVDGANRELALSPQFDLATNRRAVGIRSKPYERDHYQLLKLTKGRWHLW